MNAEACWHSTPMTHDEFQSRVRSFRRAVRPWVIAYFVFIFTGPFFTWPLLLTPIFRWFSSVFGWGEFAFWLTIMALVTVLVIPAYFIRRVRHRYDLYCPRCHASDRYGIFMRA